MQKRIVALILIFVVVLGVGTLILARTRSAESSENRHILELKDLVSTMAMDEAWRTARVFEGPRWDGFDERFFVLRNFWTLLEEAARIQHSENGYFPYGILSGLAGPHGSMDGKFTLSFISEEYIELLDLIMYFTEIEREMITVEVIGPFIGAERFDVP